MNISVILVSPKGPANLGGIARLMSNFGFTDLRIVEPRCDIFGDEAKMMAMAGFPILQNARLCSSLEEAQADVHWSVGFSGRQAIDCRAKTNLYQFASTFRERLDVNSSIQPTQAALVFGREEWGLKLEELDTCDFVVEIPTAEENPSLNLTSAAAIALSAIHYSLKGARDLKHPEREDRPVKRQEEEFFKKVYELLHRIKFVNLEKPEQNYKDLRAMYHRAELSDRELRILFGVLMNLEKA